MRMLVLAIVISIAGVQTQASADSLTRVHKYLANSVLALTAVCLSCSSPPAPQPEARSSLASATADHHDHAQTMPIEIINVAPSGTEFPLNTSGILNTAVADIIDISNALPVDDPLHTENIHTIMINATVPIILTFDDGPDTRKLAVNGTRRVLDTLADFDFNAVFFIQTHARSRSGSYYRAKHKGIGTPLVERMEEEGHIIAAHTGMDAWGAHAMANNHVRREAAGKLGEDLERSKAFIYELTGEYPKFVRPPFGTQNKSVRERYAKHDLKMILWDVDSRDTRRGYERGDIEKHLMAQVSSLAKTGDALVILFHDIDYHTYDTDNLASYIKIIEQSIHAKNLNADFKMSKQEIEETLLD